MPTIPKKCEVIGKQSGEPFFSKPLFYEHAMKAENLKMEGGAGLAVGICGPIRKPYLPQAGDFLLLISAPARSRSQTCNPKPK